MSTQQNFTASGTFVVPAGVTVLEKLLKVAGGGSGGKSARGGGGGGAGGIVEDTNIAVVPGETLTITIGAGGAAPTLALTAGNNGGTTSVVGSTTGTVGVSPAGGGGGGGVSNVPGVAGGSGGGGSGGVSGNTQSGGTASPAGQGNAGGAGTSNSITNSRAGGGGGGKSAAGSAGVGGNNGGNGGAGTDYSATYGAVGGAAGVFGGGGGGGRTNTSGGAVGAGGTGGGGVGGSATSAPLSVGGNGVPNTGGGGGGSGTTASGAAGTDGTPGAGGSGFVALRYTPPAAPNIPTSVTASNPHSTTLDLSWSAPSGGGPVTSYQVRVNGGAPSTATSPHTFTGLTPATSYTLEVRAVGPGGNSAYVSTGAVSTLTPPPPGYYRVDLDLGAHSWSIEHDDPPAYGPILPLSLGWEIPDNVEFFPAQPNATGLTFGVQTADASDLSDVVNGSVVSFRMYVSDDPDADPWQTFDGIVVQQDGAFVPSSSDPDLFDYRITVYALDNTLLLAGMFVGFNDNWPIESVYDRLARICTEAGIDFNATMVNLGLEGWLAGRSMGAAISVLEAVKTTLKDVADLDTSPDPDRYGRDVFGYFPGDGFAPAELMLAAFQRHVTDTFTLDGGKVRTVSGWSKRPGPSASSWVLVDGVQFGPGAGVPYVRNTSLLDWTGDPPDTETNYSELTREYLGNSLLPDGSTQLDGWSAKTLVYEAHLDPEPVTDWCSPQFRPTGSGAAAAPFVRPVIVTPIGPELEVNDVDYLAGTLTGARLTIPPGGRFYVTIQLRAELLPGTDLP